MEEEIEIWKDIVGYEGFYQVSNMGNVKSNGIIIEQKLNVQGYLHIMLKINGKGVAKSKLSHRLVAIAFIPNPENKPEVNHMFMIKTDNRASQLEWMTGKENREHYWGKELTEYYANKKKIRILLKEKI